jgi:hypothetical protein
MLTATATNPIARAAENISIALGKIEFIFLNEKFVVGVYMYGIGSQVFFGGLGLNYLLSMKLEKSWEE